MKAEELSERLWEFAARVANLVEALPDSRVGRHVAEQLIRSGTSPAPKYDEARSAESRADFAHKLGIATKEMRETFGWLRFTVRAELLADAKVTSLSEESGQLLKLLTESAQATKGAPDTKSRSPDPKSPASNLPGLEGLDHFAIAVPDTEAALKLWRDTFGFEVLYSEDVNDATVRLTHLDLGNAQMQLVEPLTPDHPLQAWLAAHGPGLHHVCMKVDDVDRAKVASPVPTAPAVHQGTQGKRALFLDKDATQGVQVELTGK